MIFWVCYLWYQSEFPNTRTGDWPNSHTNQENKKILTMFKNDLCIEILNFILQEMEGVKASAEDGSHHNN